MVGWFIDCVLVNWGLLSLLTIFQLYHDYHTYVGKKLLKKVTSEALQPSVGVWKH